jgi:hypothetical protein
MGARFIAATRCQAADDADDALDQPRWLIKGVIGGVNVIDRTAPVTSSRSRFRAGY